MDASLDDEWSDADKEFMRAALEEADKARQLREVPVGCVIVKEGSIIARGHNLTNIKRNGTRHAEFEAIDQVLAANQGDVNAAGFDRCVLYVTVEPCIMCAGALALLGFKEVVYGCGNDRFGGAGSIMHIHQEGCGHCGRVPGAESTPNQPAQAQDGTGVEGGAGALASQAAAAGANTHHTVGTHEQGEAEPCLQGAPAPETAPAPPATASAEGISPQGVHHLQGFPCRRGLFAAEAVRQLQDFYICGNPAAPKPHRPVLASS